MKAILLAGGKGTRLRPLTIHTPKPIVPIFNRPFLHYQIDLLKQVPEIDEVILSLNYQPRRIEEIFGDGSDVGIKIRYVVEPAPLGTAGAIKYAGDNLTESVVVFNGDMLTEIDLAAVIRLHRERQARATIVLTPVDNPSAYGLVETDDDGPTSSGSSRSRSPRRSRPTTSTRGSTSSSPTRSIGSRATSPGRSSGAISRRSSSATRRSSPTSTTATGSTSARPEKYTAGPPRHHGRPLPAPCRSEDLPEPRTWVSPDARIEEGAAVEGPCFVDEGVLVKAGARIGPYSVIGKQTQIEEGVQIEGGIIWPNCRVSRDASVRNAILGRNCHLGRNTSVNHGAVLGDKTTLTDYTRV